MQKTGKIFLCAVFLVGILLVLRLLGCQCMINPVLNSDNICEIYRKNQKWYEYTCNSSEKWGIPVHVLMAIMHRESNFRSNCRPPRTTVFYIFPGPRQSTAYGYAQALDSTWKDYQDYIDNPDARRDSFEDAIDFVGWYCRMSFLRCGIEAEDAYNLYLAYHEGHNGFNRKKFRNKVWLKRIAWEIRSQAMFYKTQLEECAPEFDQEKTCFIQCLI